MNWPNKVWEMGGESPEGKQLWCSRIATPADHARRREYEIRYMERRAKRLSAAEKGQTE